MEDEIASIVASSNNIFYYQVDIYLVVAETLVKTSSDADSWNQDNSVGCVDINTYLDDFSAWRHDVKPTVGATWMAMTNCYPSGMLHAA